MPSSLHEHDIATTHNFFCSSCGGKLKAKPTGLAFYEGMEIASFSVNWKIEPHRCPKEETPNEHF